MDVNKQDEALLGSAVVAPAIVPIRFTSVTTKGFGRESSELGIPTANLDRVLTETHPKIQFEDLPCGIYWGFCRILSRKRSGAEQVQDDDDDDDDEAESSNCNSDSKIAFTTCTAAISIGYNPTYGNEFKTVEPHIIAPPMHQQRHASSCGETIFSQDLYDRPIRLSVVGYLRPELPFEGIDKLIDAIKQDIVHSERLAESLDEDVLMERAWVDVND
ncbi:hypothetical protein MPSEU_000571700 [Mayamaea pseudoterrestris]|nr:hypothetical protein MPSEU_000571700 [Mayamaea pseudoterrestris]